MKDSVRFSLKITLTSKQLYKKKTGTSIKVKWVYNNQALTIEMLLLSWKPRIVFSIQENRVEANINNSGADRIKKYVKEMNISKKYSIRVTKNNIL